VPEHAGTFHGTKKLQTVDLIAKYDKKTSKKRTFFVRFCTYFCTVKKRGTK